MSAPRCWGIYRELAHSPGREVDDTEILRATARRLEALGFSVALLTPEEAASEKDPPRLAFVMCERLPILEKLERWEAGGTRLVNSTAAIRNTYRDRMIPLFEKAGVSFPRSVLVSTRSTSEGRGEGVALAAPFWVKRGDVHNTQAGDVVYAADRREAAAALEAMAGRGIERALVQEHAPGDLIKFYGAGSWFQWFYHKDQKLSGHSFDAAALAAQARLAAGALSLEVWGGDAIATQEGRLFVIDLNAWPSFALYRATASQRIAAVLAKAHREARNPVETP